MSRFLELLNEAARVDPESPRQEIPVCSSEESVSRIRSMSIFAEMERALSASLRPGFTNARQFVSGESASRTGVNAIEVKVSPDRRAPLTSQALDGSIVEHYRRLRTKVLQQQQVNGFKTLLITSPNPQEGKTVTVFNLGLSFALIPSFKVLVVDGDLRRGSLRHMLGLSERPGFSNLLDGTATLSDVVLTCPQFPLHFMTAGSSTASAGELLQSEDLRRTLKGMAEHFSLVLVDAPPANILTDVQLLGGSCDAVLLVARAFRTKRTQLEKAMQELASFRVIGTVLNCGSPMRRYGRYKNYY